MIRLIFENINMTLVVFIILMRMVILASVVLILFRIFLGNNRDEQFQIKSRSKLEVQDTT